MFFISVSSVVLQGSALSLMAKWLHVSVPEKVKRKFLLDIELSDDSRSELVELDIPDDAESLGKAIVQLDLPKSSLIALIHRDNKYLTPSGDTVLQGGDHLLVIADSKEVIEEVYRRFGVKHE